MAASKPDLKITSDIKLLAPVPTAIVPKYTLKSAHVLDLRHDYVPPFPTTVGAPLVITEQQNCVVSASFRNRQHIGNQFYYLYDLTITDWTLYNGEIFFRVKQYPDFQNMGHIDNVITHLDWLPDEPTRVSIYPDTIPFKPYGMFISIVFPDRVGGFGYSIPENFYPFVPQSVGSQNFTINGKDRTAYSLAGLDSVEIENILFQAGNIESPVFASDSLDILYYSKNY